MLRNPAAKHDNPSHVLQGLVKDDFHKHVAPATNATCSPLLTLQTRPQLQSPLCEMSQHLRC